MSVAFESKAPRKFLVVISALVMVYICSSGVAQQVANRDDLERQNADLKRKIADLQRQVASLSAQLEVMKSSSSTPLGSTLDLQEKCAAKGAKDFEEWSFKGKENADYVAHYNRKLDRCFVQFQNTANQGEFFWRQLFDAYSGKEYGEYAWQQKKDKKNWEVPPFVCHVEQLNGDKTHCNSDDEFGVLAKAFMEQ